MSLPIIFVRHGESESNVYLHENNPDASTLINKHGDPMLTTTGHNQSFWTGQYLSDAFKEYSPIPEKIVVYCSPFTRTRETCKHFLTHYGDGIEYTEDVLLTEYTSVRKQLTDEHKSRGLTHDLNWEAFVGRVKSFIDKLVVPNDKPIVVFGHSLWVSVAVSYLSSQKTYVPAKVALSFEFPNCSITTIQYKKAGNTEEARAGNIYVWKVGHVGSIAHLPKRMVTGCHTPFGTVDK
jgi:broad specificity phosphatase PhoE